jgi:hypothetical protein
MVVLLLDDGLVQCQHLKDACGDTAEVDESLIGIGNKRRTSPETWQMSG